MIVIQWAPTVMGLEGEDIFVLRVVLVDNTVCNCMYVIGENYVL